MKARFSPNYSVERTGASRSAQRVSVAQWRLANKLDEVIIALQGE
ncbi:MAG: hypothetical protein ABSD29_19325 [Verrucomicrobiota bacterium]